MRNIEVDNEVFETIKQKAEPFVDKTPNDVLRKLLLKNGNIACSTESTGNNSLKEAMDFVRSGGSRNSTGNFVDRFLREKFPGKFRPRSSYQWMFESNEQIVYFQNFNKPNRPNLWFRLHKKPLNVLRSSGKEAYVCLTIPAENYGFCIPLSQIDNHIHLVGWDREDLEVNISSADSKWRELSWNIGEYKNILI